ncbi:MAG: TolC family outer membrane protein [Nitrospirota bacterium]
MSIRIVSTTAMATAWLVACGPAHAIDLMGSYQRALGVDPSFLAAKEAREAGREQAVQGRALLLPNITASGDATWRQVETESDLAAQFGSVLPAESAGNLYGYSVTLKQPLYRAEAFATNQQFKGRSELAEVSYRDAQQAVILRVARAYFGVLLAQDTVRLTAAQKAATKEQLDTAQARFDAGRARITDVRDAQARYDAILASEIAAESELVLRRAEYEEVTGQAADGLAEVRPEVAPLPAEPADLAVWQAEGLDGSPQVRAKQQQLAIAAAEVDKYRFLSRPTLDLIGSYSDSRHSGDLSPVVAPDRNQSTSVVVQVSVPLFQGGSINSQLREARAKQREATQDLDAAKRDARLQVREAFLAVSTGVAQVKALEQALESAKTSVDAAAIGLDVGVRTTLDVLDAQQRYYATQRDLARARYDYLLGRLQLPAAIGQLTENEVMAVNAYLLDEPVD